MVEKSGRIHGLGAQGPETPVHAFRAVLAPVRSGCYGGGVPSHQSESIRHVGRIVDPSVSDENGSDPVDEAPAPSVRAEQADPAPVPTPEEQVPSGSDRLGGERTGRPLSRLRGVLRPELIPDGEAAGAISERVDQVGAKLGIPVPVAVTGPSEPLDGSLGDDAVMRSSVSGMDELEQERAQARGSRDQELDRVGSGLMSLQHFPGVRIPGRGRRLSPNLVALFGALLGLALVATLIAVAVSLDHRPRDLVPPRPVASAPASSQPSAQQRPKPSPRRQRQKIPGPYRIADSENDAALRIHRGQIGYESFIKAVQKAGVPEKEAYRVVAAFRGVRSLDSCARTDRFVAAINRSSRRLVAFEFITGPEEIYQARENGEGRLEASKLDLKVRRDRVAGAILVDEAGLATAIEQGGFEAPLARVLGEALAGHANLEELDRGTRLRLVVQEVTALGEFARYAFVEAVEVVFSDDREPVRVYRFQGPRFRGYLDSSGRALDEGGWRKPIPNAPVTSRFNLRRMHPVLHRTMPHTGMDFGAPMGTPIGAASIGTISFIGYAGPNGNLVKIQHPGGIETGYSHLSRFAEGLKINDKVRRLQTIGYVGSTGRSTGPHLHFSAKRAGKFFDPETLHMDGMRTIPSADRAVFEPARRELDTLLDAIVLPPALQNPPAASSPATAAPDVAPSQGWEEEAEPSMDPPAPVASPTPTGQPAPATPVTPATRSGSSSIYLSDEELLKMQNRSDDGEVP